MRAKNESGRLFSHGLRFLAVGTILGITGCGSSTKVGAPTPQPAATGTTNGASTNAKSSSTTISPELVQKVNDLVRLHQEYATKAKDIQTFDDFKQQADALSGLDQQISSLVEDIMIAEAKLSAAEKAEFDSKYYAPAKPAIEEQRREKMRIQGLVR